MLIGHSIRRFEFQPLSIFLSSKGAWAMCARGRLAGRLLLPLILLFTAVAGATSTPADQQPAIPPEQPNAWIRPEVRLRKLHLVRPDLIPYPVAYAVYC